MNEMTTFESPMFGSIRGLEIDGEPWFVGKDVAQALGYKLERKAILDHVDPEDKGVTKWNTPGGPQQVTIINESGLYSLILSSKLPNARDFKHWVTSEVIPSIRKHGGYIHGQAEMSDDELMAKALLVAQRQIQERDQRISDLTVTNQIMQPKADYFDQLVDRNLLTNFRETAKLIGVKEKAFIQFLLDKKYIYRNKRGQLMPYADRDRGCFEVKESTNEKTGWSGTQTLITPKGRETFRLLCEGM